MPIGISYMGTKQWTAAVVGRILDRLPSGPMLDLFSGMCAVSEAGAASRNIWINDTQRFPVLVGQALFTAQVAPLESTRARSLLEPHIDSNRIALTCRFSRELCREQDLLTSGKQGHESFVERTDTSTELEEERKALALARSTFPYRLSTIIYAGAFFGLRQSIDIDSIRYAIDRSYELGLISPEQKRWFLIGLCCSASRINNSTGHFAQYLKLKAHNADRVLRQRSRNAIVEFWRAMDTIRPIGTAAWRSHNRYFRSEATELLRLLKTNGDTPSVVYADPPFSEAQYSRYYHVLEELIEYRYPKVRGTGLYGDGRFQSKFAHLGAVESMMERLISGVAETSASLVLSYPSNGLLQRCGVDVRDILTNYFKENQILCSIERRHSSFGGANTTASVPVVEKVYLSQNPRGN